MESNDVATRAGIGSVCAAVLCACLSVGNAWSQTPSNNSIPAARLTAPPTQATINFRDARPSEELKQRDLSHFVLSCDFGVQAFSADMPRLQSTLSQGLGDRLRNRPIIVDHYVIYLNTSAQSRGNDARLAIGGAAGELVASSNARANQPRCTRDKMHGWFEAAELTTPWSPFIVEMEVHVDGKRHLVRSVYSPPRNMPPAFGGVGIGRPAVDAYIAMALAMRAAQDKANGALVAEIATQIP